MYVIPASKIVEIANLYREGWGVRGVASRVGVAERTAQRYRPEGLVCPCGEKAGHQGWCEWRIGLSPQRQAYLKQCAEMSQARQVIHAARVRERQEDSAWWYLIRQLAPQPERLRTIRRRTQRLPPLATCYPYIRQGEESELLLLVNSAVPRTVRSDVRADVCQELLLAILTGELTRENFIDSVPQFIREAYKQIGDKYKEISLDAPLYRDGQTYTLLDVLAASETESDTDLIPAKHTYVRGGMPYAGALADCESAADLAERLSDHWQANRLLSYKRRTERVGIHVADRETDNREIQVQVAGVGRMKMSSYVRHPGHAFQLRDYRTKARDEIMFSVREYRERRAMEELNEEANK